METETRCIKQQEVEGHIFAKIPALSFTEP